MENFSHVLCYIQAHQCIKHLAVPFNGYDKRLIIINFHYNILYSNFSIIQNSLINKSIDQRLQLCESIFHVLIPLSKFIDNIQNNDDFKQLTLINNNLKKYNFNRIDEYIVLQYYNNLIKYEKCAIIEFGVKLLSDLIKWFSSEIINDDFNTDFIFEILLSIPTLLHKCYCVFIITLIYLFNHINFMSFYNNNQIDKVLIIDELYQVLITCHTINDFLEFTKTKDLKLFTNKMVWERLIL
jgi:hypothetical protein